MRYSEIKRRIANPGERCYYDRRYAICNEFGAIAFVYANCEQDALDEAMDAGKLDSELMDMVDYREALEEGWDDSYILLGNASEPVCAHYLSIQEI